MKKKSTGEKNDLRRISVPCCFRHWNHSREFTSPGNLDALNLLKNKLDKLGISDREGELIFEYDHSEKSIRNKEWPH